MSRTRLQYIRATLYRMKRSYGLPIDLCQQILGSTNLETGEKDITYMKTHIARAIVQPARTSRSFVYDLAYISANKDFTSGGFFDASDRRVIIDAADLPADWELDNDQFVIFNNRRFDIKGFYEFEANMGFILMLRETKGQKMVRLMDAVSILSLEQSVGTS